MVARGKVNEGYSGADSQVAGVLLQYSLVLAHSCPAADLLTVGSWVLHPPSQLSGVGTGKVTGWKIARSQHGESRPWQRS